MQNQYQHSEVKPDLRMASRMDIPALYDLVIQMGSGKVDGYFDRSLDYQEMGKRIVLIAAVDGCDVGYCMLSWEPKYTFYRKLGVPEIQDLNVIPQFRRRGIARFIIAHCENLAREKSCEYMGIGVGLDASYGAAQRLYIRLGYVPDGNGVTYDRQTLAHGALKPVDDDMSLMLIKDLQM